MTTHEPLNIANLEEEDRVEEQDLSTHDGEVLPGGIGEFKTEIAKELNSINSSQERKRKISEQYVKPLNNLISESKKRIQEIMIKTDKVSVTIQKLNLVIVREPKKSTRISAKELDLATAEYYAKVKKEEPNSRERTALLEFVEKYKKDSNDQKMEAIKEKGDISKCELLKIKQIPKKKVLKLKE